MRKGMLAAILCLLLTLEVGAAGYRAEEAPELRGAVVVVGDLLGDGTEALLVGKGQAVYLYEDGEGQKLIGDISGEISALAIGDLTGDLRPNLLVGTKSAGALYCYSERGGIWRRAEQPQYLWDTILSLETADFNQDGWGDLAALTEEGQLLILLSSEGKLFPFWRSLPEQVVNHFEIVDLTQDGLPELIYTYESGYIGIVSWREGELKTIWENYPWGALESLVILSPDTLPEWLVVTSQKMLYGWRFKGDEVISTRHFHGAELGEYLFRVPGQGLLSFSKKSGASLLELKSESTTPKWRLEGVLGVQAFQYGGELYFQDPAGRYYRLAPGESELRLFVEGREVTDLVEVLELPTGRYFNLQDLSPLLGLELSKTENWQVQREGLQLELQADLAGAKYGELLLPLTAAPLELEQGRELYVPAALLTLLGWRVEEDPIREQVSFWPDWGWWF